MDKASAIGIEIKPHFAWMKGDQPAIFLGQVPEGVERRQHGYEVFVAGLRYGWKKTPEQVGELVAEIVRHAEDAALADEQAAAGEVEG